MSLYYRPSPRIRRKKRVRISDQEFWSYMGLMTAFAIYGAIKSYHFFIG